MGTDLLIGVALGLLTTLTLFALLILAFVKIQSRRRSPPSQQQQQQQQQLHQQSDEPLAANSRTFLSASPSSSEDPDLIPLQMSKISKLTVNGSGPSTAAEPTTLSQEVMGLNPARFRTFFFLFYLEELQPWTGPSWRCKTTDLLRIILSWADRGRIKFNAHRFSKKLTTQMKMLPLPSGWVPLSYSMG